MAIMAMDTARQSNVCVFCLSLLCSKLAFAGDWQFDPSLKVDETYTDNVALTRGNEQSSIVSQTGILFDSSYNSQHVDFNLASESTYAFYSHDHELDNDYHTLASDIRFQLWPNGLSIIASVNVANQSQNSSRNALADIVSADTVQVETYNGGVEYIVNNSDFIVNSTASYQEVTAEDDIGNRNELSASIGMQNGRAARTTFWNIQHNYQKLKNNENDGEIVETEAVIGYISDFKINPFIRYYNEDNTGNVNNGNRSLESNSYGAGLRWLVSSRLYIDASYNKPTGNKLDLDGNAQKEYINAQINWEPSARTKLEASYSERFYGDSYGFNLQHRNRRLSNTVDYTESVQTLTRNNYIPVVLGFFWCPADTVVNAISDCIVQDGTTIAPEGYQLNTFSNFELAEDAFFSLNKNLSWNSTLTLPRTTFTLIARKENRENLDTRIEDDNSYISVSIKRRVSGRSNVNLQMSYTDTNLQIDTEQERQDKYRRYQVGYEKSLNSTLSFNIDFSYVNRTSNDFTLNYKEGRVSAKITKGF